MPPAERDQSFPTISALGSVGLAAMRNDHLSSWDGAVGVKVKIPVFNGIFPPRRGKPTYVRRSHKKKWRTSAIIAGDVRTAWRTANTYNCMAVAQAAARPGQQGSGLAQTRYNLGLGLIVELSQAQAGYDYRLALTVLRYQTEGL